MCTTAVAQRDRPKVIFLGRIATPPGKNNYECDFFCRASGVAEYRINFGRVV